MQTGNSEALLREIGTHRITLEGGFAVVFRNRAPIGQYQLPQDDGRAIIRSWMDETESDVAQGQEPLSHDRFACRPAQRRAHAGDRQRRIRIRRGKHRGRRQSWSRVCPSRPG